MGRRSALIACVLAGAVMPAIADDLRATVPDGVVGDGRTAVPVVVNGKPVGGGKELPVPEVPVVTCATAPGLAAIGAALPAVLTPAITAPQTVECTARLRTSETKFQLKLRPPAAGLYASTDRIARTTDGEAKLATFVWDGKRRNVPSWLKAAASDGDVSIGKGGALTLDLSGKAPRTVAVAMIDGSRVGAAFVPVTGSTVLPVESEADSSVQVWVAGTWYGPVQTKGKIAQVPIDVPAGVTHGVARSTDKKGYVSDVVIDLKIPARPRIAVASAAPTIGAGEPMTLAIAIAGADARPAPDKAKLVVAAERGTVEPVRSLGGGLWTLRYMAPGTQGADRISVKVDGDDRAGTGEVTLDVRGIAAKIELNVAQNVEPGSELTGTVRVLDAGGNALREPEIGATLGGDPVEVVAGEPMTLVGRIPKEVPPSGVLPLEVVSGSARVKLDLHVGGAAEHVKMRASVDDADVRVELRVTDRYGNLVPQSAFEVTVANGTLSSVRRDGDHYVASVVGNTGATSTTVSVRAKGRSLSDLQIGLDPRGVIRIGAWAGGGWLDNLGAWSSPRGGAGGGVSRNFGAFEGALLAGVDVMSSSETFVVDLNGSMQDATRSIIGIGIPLTLRARFRLTERFGVSAGAAFVPWSVRVKFGPDGQTADAYTETVVGFRAHVAGDVALGPGRVVIGAAFGRARLADGAVVGQIDGVGLTVGYEWWFGAFAP